mmetsp:Transcript_14905/g.40814  ORF Transcript_14905/g.40814 Transcript_14905/m.40814 type:complete len:233 (+) Transcript_14905:280-978(+)
MVAPSRAPPLRPPRLVGEGCTLVGFTFFMFLAVTFLGPSVSTLVVELLRPYMTPPTTRAVATTTAPAMKRVTAALDMPSSPAPADLGTLEPGTAACGAELARVPATSLRPAFLSLPVSSPLPAALLRLLLTSVTEAPEPRGTTITAPTDTPVTSSARPRRRRVLISTTLSTCTLPLSVPAASATPAAKAPSSKVSSVTPSSVTSSTTIGSPSAEPDTAHLLVPAGHMVVPGK